MGRLVLGFDGSEASGCALDWALREAKLRQAPLVIIEAVDPSLPGSAEARGHNARRVLDGALELAAAGGVQALGVLESGSPADVLLRASKDAELLVVGESIAAEWLDDATTAVVVVPLTPGPTTPLNDGETLPFSQPAA